MIFRLQITKAQLHLQKCAEATVICTTIDHDKSLLLWQYSYIWIEPNMDGQAPVKKESSSDYNNIPKGNIFSQCISVWFSFLLWLLSLFLSTFVLQITAFELIMNYEFMLSFSSVYVRCMNTCLIPRWIYYEYLYWMKLGKTAF